MPYRRNRIFRSQMTTGLLALAFFLILATSAVSVTSTNSLGRSIDAVNHSSRVLALATQMKVALGETQAHGLRFMVTGSAEDHMLQRQALADLDKYNKEFSSLTKDNPLQRSYIADFITLYKTISERSQKSMQMKVEAMKAGDDWGPIQRIRSSKGYLILNEMRATLEKITDEENRLMGERIKERDDLVKQTNATVLIANALALVAGILGFAAIRRSQEESEQMLLAEISAEQARQANEEKSSFLANMSHEIRTPMNAIFGFTQLLSESVTAPLERDWVMSIKKSGNMLLGLINDVLDLSKIEAGKLQLQPQAVEVGELVAETVELFSPVARDKGIFLTNDSDLVDKQPLMIDGQRFRQILMNLLSNAIKYTERGGVVARLIIEPQAEPGLRTIRLLVTDSGVGIDPQQLVKIFHPFHQADSPDGKIRQGTGLGLSICKRLVDVMEGSIEVTSNIGKGSTFMVEIPNVALAEKTPQPRAGLEGKVDFNQLQPLKVLVVDDVEWNIEIAQGYLRDSHHVVHAAGSGLDAVVAAQMIKPDVVLMDLRMPGMNGYEAADAIRSDPLLQEKRTEIIAVTASSLNNQENILRESFDGYVQKPYTPADLFHALKSIFGAEEMARAAGSSTPKKWNEVQQAAWQLLRDSQLQEVRQSMRMREIGDYSKRLQAFSEETEFDLLEERAVALQNAVQRFDVAAVKNALADIADMPESFDVV